MYEVFVCHKNPKFIGLISMFLFRLSTRYLFKGMLTIVGLFGVIKMWKLQKVGFMLYTGASVVSMIMGIVYSGFGVMGVIFPILFIVLYGLNLKHLK